MPPDRSDAIDSFQRSVLVAVRAARVAARGNLSDLAKASAGSPFWPGNYLRITERNGAAWIAIALVSVRAFEALSTPRASRGRSNSPERARKGRKRP